MPYPILTPADRGSSRFLEHTGERNGEERSGRNGWKEGRWKIIGRKAIGREARRACISEHASFRGEACIGRVTTRLLLALRAGKGREGGGEGERGKGGEDVALRDKRAVLLNSTRSLK